MRMERDSNFTIKNEICGKNRDKPGISAGRNKVAVKVVDYVFESLFKKYFYSLRVKNKHNYYLRNSNYANLFYGFHSCWWDGPLATILCRKLYDCDFHIMVKDLYRFPALSLVGGFSVEKNSRRGILAAVNHSVKLLENPENSLWLFPQGNVCFPDFRPITFQSGIAHICSRLKGVNLIPVTYKYTFLRKEKPEILAEIGKPITLEGGVNNKKLFLKNLEQELERFIDYQRQEISRGEIEEYECILEDNFNFSKFVETTLKPLLRIQVN